MVIYDVMKSLLDLYNSNPNDSTAINNFIADNIHPEPYITEDLVDTLIACQKEGLKVDLDDINDEDQLIAGILVGAYIELDIYVDWANVTHNVNPTGFDKEIIPVIKRFLLPKYSSIIAPLCECKVDFERELTDYNPRITMDYDREWSIILMYNSNFNSCFRATTLDRDTLKDIKARAEAINLFAKKLEEYLEDRNNFLSRTYNFLGNDDYQRRENGIYLDRANNIHRKYIAVDAAVWYNDDHFHDINVSHLTLVIKAFSGYNIIATICDKVIKLEDGMDFSEVKLFDLDDAFEKIRLLVNSNYKKAEFFDD